MTDHSPKLEQILRGGMTINQLKHFGLYRIEKKSDGIQIFSDQDPRNIDYERDYGERTLYIMGKHPKGRLRLLRTLEPGI